MNANRKAIVLLSGGLDSSTALAIAKSQGFIINALTIGYGQRNHVELKAAERVGLHFSVLEHRFLSLDLRLFGGSSLTSGISVKAHDEENHIPNTYVPARNTIMLSLALAYAEVSGAFDIFFGANVHDYAGYPDCRPAYVEAYENMANLALKSTTSGQKLRIHVPLINMSKAEIIKTGLALGVDYGMTHSCYDPVGDRACGRCSACHYRKKGFQDAQVMDVTAYASSNNESRMMDTRCP